MHNYHLRLLTCLGILLFALSLTGCRICNSNEDLDYPTYGGSWQRTVRDHGRVGSIFDPAGAKIASLSERDTPNTEDEIERARPENQEDPNDSDQDANSDDSDPDSPDDRDALLERDQDDEDDDWDGRDLDDLQGDKDDSLKDIELDDIEVRIVPGKPPVMINTK